MELKYVNVLGRSNRRDSPHLGASFVAQLLKGRISLKVARYTV